MTNTNHSLRTRLLIGASIGSLLLAGAAEAQSNRIGQGRGGGNPAAAAARVAQAEAQRVTERNSATQRAVEAMRRAAQTRAQMNDAQVQARIAAQNAINTIPNGMGAGGLQQAPGIEIDPSLWQGANGPIESAGKDGRTTVTVDQDQHRAILTWDSFNIGRETDLVFNQAYGADAVVLNRVRDASPSQIHGTLTAPGTVLILNQNGVLFGGTSSVNVRNLIASSANIADADFLDANRGIYSRLSGANYLPSFTDAGGAITVAAGAQITTHAPASATQGGGYVMLMGTEVINEGSIVTARGQTLLSAGDDFSIRKGFGTEENQYSTTRGNEVRGLIDAESTSGTVINRGLIEAAQGDITLGGRTIRQEGVLVATTGVNQRGTIHLLNSATDTQGSVTLASGWELSDVDGKVVGSGEGLTIILPELDSEDTALNGQRDSLIEQSETANLNRYTTTSGGFNDRSLLADRLDQSRIEIVTGGDVVFEGGSQTSAQGGQVAVQAAGRITAEDGSLIDVSGVQGIALDMESNSILVNVQGNELRDSPENRENANLRSNDVWIDVRDLVLLPDGTGGYDGDRWYTKGGLLEVGGHLNNMAHGIGEWAAIGGTITLAANEVVAQRGATFDISGGSLDYQAGWVLSTRVLGADGKLYDLANAPAGMKMVAWGDAFVREHSRWGEQYTQVWSHPISGARSVRRWSDGYTVGRDAGQLILSTPTAIMEGDIIAAVIEGERQVNARADGITDGYDVAQHTRAQAGSLILGRYDLAQGNTGPYAIDVRIAEVADTTAELVNGEPLAENRIGTAWFDADRLNDAQLGGLKLETTESIAVERDLSLADGGALDLVAPTIDLGANIAARGGSISATNMFEGGIGRGQSAALLDPEGAANITLREGSTLDVRGVWVNSALNDDDTRKLGLIDGGSVHLASTHDLVLEQGSFIDASSGAALLSQNQTRGGVGGNVTLIADLEYSDGGSDQSSGLLTLNGEIAAFGVNGGGSLKVESGRAISIGGDLLETEGTLTPGETALADLILITDYDVKAGERLPVDYTYSIDTVLPGEMVGALLRPNVDYTLADDWTLPVPARGGYSVLVRNPQGGVTLLRIFYYTTEPIVIPKDSVVYFQIPEANFPVNYVVPEQVFPDGLKLLDGRPATVRAGLLAPDDFTIPAGSLIRAGAVLARPVSVEQTTTLSASLFQSGFSSYDVVGRQGVLVPDDVTLRVEAPVFRPSDGALSVATGSNPSDALEQWTPPQWIEDPVAGVLQPRAGADLVLRASLGRAISAQDSATGVIHIGNGSRITVDPGHSIGLVGTDVTIEGALEARGGGIAIDSPMQQTNPLGEPNVIWIGEGALLDVSGIAATAIANAGYSYGRVLDGGTISIGGDLDWEESGQANVPGAYVVIRPGSVLDASGASATLTYPSSRSDRASETVAVNSDGGSIVLKSAAGLFIDGDLSASAGGAGAAGGTLALALEAPLAALSQPNIALSPPEFVLSQSRSGHSLPADVDRADALSTLAFGKATLGVDEILAGGFDNLSLLVNGPLSFDGSVALDLAQSLRLYAGSFSLTDDAANDSIVTLSAPYLRLAGVTKLAPDHMQLIAARWSEPQRESEAIFHVSADIVDIRDRVGFGVSSNATIGTPFTVDRRGFGLVDITSRGDLRLLQGLSGRGLSGEVTTELRSTGDISLTARQIYPATNTVARILAGYRSGVPFASGSTLDIHRYGDGAVATPYSVFGSLTLGAETVNQGGIVRAPLGYVTLGLAENIGSSQETATTRVNLLDGSITSVSAAGLIMPYGGTVDGITYTYGGKEVGPRGVVSNSSGGIVLNAALVEAEAGSTLDLSGGGELAGAGFVSGRGGSVDILTTPLVNSNPGYGFSNRENAVYAIVPSSNPNYAPVAPDAGYGDPLLGQQITIPDGIPGLPAGTYTLMPSTYAVLDGAFRVEIGAGDQMGLRGVTAIGNGSYLAPGTLSVANTAIREALPNQIVVTPAETVKAHSSYNDMSYNEFVVADAGRLGVPRGLLTVDAKTLDLFLLKNSEQEEGTALNFGGQVLLDAEPESKGYAGTVHVRGVSEILAAGQTPTQGLAGVSVTDEALNSLNAPRLVLNGRLGISYGQAGRYVDVTGDFMDLTVRSGALVEAGELIFAGRGSRRDNRGLIVEEGATLSTIGRQGGSFDSTDGYVFTSTGMLALSNGWLNLLLAQPTGTTTGWSFDIGACVTSSCEGETRLVSDGTIAIATDRSFTMADNVSYGTRNLVLGISSVNLGEGAAIDAARTAGNLPDGLALNQAKLADLLAGNVATGAPALETLVLNVRDAVNVFGSVELDASSLERIVFGTPAIYGYGGAEDVATIRAGEFIWTGADTVAGAPVASLLGSGALAIEARDILFGYGPNTQPASNAKDERLALGFANVSLNASERIAASGESALSVYQSRGDFVGGEGWQYAGGNLSIETPLFTGEAGSKFSVAAGGNVVVTSPEGAAVDPTSDALGAQLSIAARSITLDTAVVLPSGRLRLESEQDITLADNAWIDLSGREVELFDVKRYSWGGDLILASAAGDISAATGSHIDLSAEHNRGGAMTVTALGAGAGRVDLAGAILGSATGEYDAGGTIVPYDAAELTVRAQTLADFGGLNSRLNEGEVFGARRFQIKQGDLVVGDGVKARDVQIVVDGGNLTINGTIDASGYQVGSIRLAAMGDLTVNGTLDAHGTGLRVDSYGKIIDSPNRAIVDLTSREGTLTLANSATIDLRAGTDVEAGNEAGQHDGAARGTLDLNAARLGADDVAIDVAGTPDIRGARTIAVNAFRSYDDAPLATLPDVSGDRPQLITQAYLDTIDGHSQAFINAALANGDLSERLSGLGVYHLRPGVEIVSNAESNSGGNLTVSGDLDLSGYRYGPDANRLDPAMRGQGEPGVLAFRAAGDLTIHGSITDGFAPPPETPDDIGWVLTEGTTPFSGDVVIPIDGIVLDRGTIFATGVTLNYDVPVNAMTLPTGTVLPVDAVLTGTYSMDVGTVVAANIYNADGSLAYSAGDVLADTVTLVPGMRLGAGTPLSADAAVAAMTWPKDVPLPVQMVTSGHITLARGSLIPSTTNVQLVNDAPVDLRSTVNGRQGANWAVAPMLGEGATSWDLQLVAGADLSSADIHALNPASTGMIRLADTHYVMGYREEVQNPSVLVWAAGNLMNYPAGTPVSAEEAFLCDLLPGSCELQQSTPQLVWAPGNLLNYPAGTPVSSDEAFFCDLVPGSCETIGGGGETVLVRGDPTSPTFSVVRTGTGDLSLVAAGDIRMDSPYGVYTAGQSSETSAAFNKARGTLHDGTIIGNPAADYSEALAAYRAWYPDQGGNLLIDAGGNLRGDLYGSAANVGEWLWRQGSGSAAVDEAIPTAWWINFGTYVQRSGAPNPALAGFTGFGTLGGGNVTVRVAGDAGKIERAASETAASVSRSDGLVIAVASTGRVIDGETLTLMGGGDLDMKIAGALNPYGEVNPNASSTTLSGNIVNLRGASLVEASSVGQVRTLYRGRASLNPVDPRGIDPFEASAAESFSGLVLTPGDSAFYVQTLGDLVIAGSGDATRTSTLNTSPFSTAGIEYARGGNSWFSLWTDHTAINLMSAGGNMAPSHRGSTIEGLIADSWPAILRNTAMGGNVYLSAAAGSSGLTRALSADILAPSTSGELSVVAAGSIYASSRTAIEPYEGRHALVLSASGTPMPTPFNPAFVGRPAVGNVDVVSNLSLEGDATGLIGARLYWTGAQSLFAFGPNTAATASIRPSEAEPVRIYAVSGDIIGLTTGFQRQFLPGSGRTNLTWYSAGAPVVMRAGRDIVGSGRKGLTTQIDASIPTLGHPNLIVHSNDTDVSIVSAGRDIIYSNFDIAGPGSLEVSAGRNILQEDQGSFTSIGPIRADDTSDGASIALMAGMTGVNWDAVRDYYLDPSMLADPGRPLAEQNGVTDEGIVESVSKVAKLYDAELAAWLFDRYGYVAEGAFAEFVSDNGLVDANGVKLPAAQLEARLAALGFKSSATNQGNLAALLRSTDMFDYGFADSAASLSETQSGLLTQVQERFDGLSPEQQRIFLRQVYFSELREGGREYNDADGPRLGSYLRGRLAVAALFPDKDGDGNVIDRSGDIIMYRGSGVRTNFGGDIEMMAPGGQIVVGVQNVMTDEDQKTAGVMTQGSGDIRIFSEQSLLLGLSRVMTTYGGSILGWSEEGDINAGRGANTTVLYTPPLRTYDAYGNVRLAPQVPSSGAGIATLNPIPEVPAGDIDLVAPLGTIDAGEAGIRVSGNINLAALQVLNAANIKVQGEAAGIPVVAAVNTGALTSASSASSAVANQAAELAERARPQVRTEIPTILNVRFLGFGE